MQEKPLIRAHLIPRFFFKKIKDNKNRMTSIYNMDIGKALLEQDAMFDKTILCAQCDNSFSANEKYVSHFLNEDFSYLGIPNPSITTCEKGTTVHHVGVDTKKLKLFVLATVWRFSISKRHINVSLGPLQDLVLKHLKDGNPGPPSFFPFAFYSLKKVNDLRANLISAPVTTKIFGGIAFMIHLHDHFLLVQLTKNGGRQFESFSCLADTEFEIEEFDTLEGIKALNDYYGGRLGQTPKW